MNTAFLLGYLSYFGSGIVMMLLFMVIYERVTPYCELALMRQGNRAAALSFGGALLGFTLTLVSSALHAVGWVQFLAWSAVAGLLQLVVFWLVAMVVRQIKLHIENGNVAVGIGLFCASVALGALNAACLS